MSTLHIKTFNSTSKIIKMSITYSSKNLLKINIGAYSSNRFKKNRQLYNSGQRSIGLQLLFLLRTIK